MRLKKVEQGEGLFRKLLIIFISIVSGMRLPDAARIVMYHRDFYGKPMTMWTQAAMRGESCWSVGERELFAALTAKWNSCPFCINAHGTIASLVLNKTLVKELLDGSHPPNLPPKLRIILDFLEILAKTPDELTKEQIVAVLQNGISTQEFEDAVAVVALFSITVRCANALNFAALSDEDQIRAAKRMLAQGYVFGKDKMDGHPDHPALAEELRSRVLERPRLTDISLRQAIASRATGGAAVAEPIYDHLAQQVGQYSYKITDEQIEKVVQKTGSEKATFELITAAAVGAGLYRWDKGLSILQEANGSS